MPSRAERRANVYRALSGLGVSWQPVPSGWVWGGVSGLGAAVSPVDPRAQFVEWLSATYPGLVETLVARFGGGSGGGVAGLGADPMSSSGTTAAPSSLLDKIINAASSILPAYLQAKTQQQILDMQLDRLRQGLPPADVSAVQTPAVNIGLDPATIQRIADEAQARAAAQAADVVRSPWLWLVGIGGALWFLAAQDRKRTRTRAR